MSLFSRHRKEGWKVFLIYSPDMGSIQLGTHDLGMASQVFAGFLAHLKERDVGQVTDFKLDFYHYSSSD